MSTGSQKRKNPFGEEQWHGGRPAKQLKEDLPFIYERTMARIMNSGHRTHATHGSTQVNAPTQSRVPDTPSSVDGDNGSCHVCSRTPTSISCSFCEGPSCDMCTVQCEKCEGDFCAFCSTVNYDMRYDRTFCLTCDHEEQSITRRLRMYQPSTSPLQHESLTSSLTSGRPNMPEPAWAAAFGNEIIVETSEDGMMVDT